MRVAASPARSVRSGSSFFFPGVSGGPADSMGGLEGVWSFADRRPRPPYVIHLLDWPRACASQTSSCGRCRSAPFCLGYVWPCDLLPGWSNGLTYVPIEAVSGSDSVEYLDRRVRFGERALSVLVNVCAVTAAGRVIRS